MALDWNQEVSLSTILDLGRSSQRGGVGSGSLPTKTTMNLYQPERAGVDLRKLLLACVAGVLVVGIVVKLGVLDPLARLSARQTYLGEQQDLLTATLGQTADYSQVQELYDAYVVEYGGDVADVIEVLDMVEQRVMSAATLTGVSFADDKLTLTVEGTSLQTVGDIAKDLERDPLVASTHVSSATAKDTDPESTASTIVVTLAPTADEEV